MMDEPAAVRLYAGVEIADSSTRVTAMVSGADLDMVPRRATTRLTAPPLPDDAVRAVADLVSRVLGGSADPTSVEGVGIAVWGRVDAARGVVRSLPLAPQWSGFPLAERLTDLLGVPVRVTSAVNAGALTEVRLGAGRAAESLFYAHAGRSVDSAYTYRATIVAGAYGAEGQLGHLRVCDDGARCSCGLRGHLETVGSAQSIVRNLIGLASDSEASLAAMRRLSGGRPEAFTVAQVVTLAHEGNSLARRVLDDAAGAWGIALASVCTLLDPEIIAIAGPLSAGGESLLAGIRSALAAELTRDEHAARVVWAAHPLHGTLLGARLLGEEVAMHS